VNPANAWLLLTTRSSGVNLSPSGFGALRPADVALALKGLERERFLLGMAVLTGDRTVLPELIALVHITIVDLAIGGEWKEARRGSQIYRRMAAVALLELLSGDRCVMCNGKGFYDTETRLTLATADRANPRRKLRRLQRLEWKANELAEMIRKRHANKQGADPSLTRRLKRALRWIAVLLKETDFSGPQTQCRTCGGSGRQKMDDAQRAWAAGLPQDQWAASWANRYDFVLIELQGWVSDCLTHVRTRLSPQRIA
jgi:hypothetical protein